MPKSRRRPVATDRRFRQPANGADHGTPERWQHSGRQLEITERAGILAARATEEHVIDVLVLRGALTQRQCDAAMRLKNDYLHAAMQARTTGNYAPQRSSGDYFHRARERTEQEEAAYQRWRNAVRFLGMRFSAIAITVACHDLLPTPQELGVLQTSLEKLAEWYRLPAEEG